MLENNLRWKTKLWETMRGNIGISIRATAVGPSERAGAHSESSQDYQRCLELHPMLPLFLWIEANFSSALHSVSCHCGCHLRKEFEFCSCCLCIYELRRWAPMGGCLCGSSSRVSSIWGWGLLSLWRVRHISSLSATKDALPQYSLNIVGSQQDHLLLQCNGSKVQMKIQFFFSWVTNS